jgi:hypothetical protein
MDIFRRPARGPDEKRAFDWVADWLMTRTQYGGYSTWGLVGGADPSDKLVQLLVGLREEVNRGDDMVLEDAVQDVLLVYAALGEAFSGRNALDDQLLRQIINGALTLIPILESLDAPKGLFHLMSSMSTMTGCEVNVILRLLEAMAPEAQVAMDELAEEEGDDDLYKTIRGLLTGDPGPYPCQLIISPGYQMPQLLPWGQNHGRRTG